MFNLPTNARGLLVGALLVPALLLAGCGADATPTVVPTVAPTSAPTSAPTTAPVSPPTNTSAPAATATIPPAPPTATTVAAPPTDTVPVATATEAMMAASPTGAVMTATAAATVAAPTPAPTPASAWVPGAHKNTITLAGAKLHEGGVLTVGSDVSYPPQEYMDANNHPVGLDIDIANELASRMGLQLKVVNFKFDSIIPALNAGQFDLVISAMTVTTDRQAVVDFVPYFDAGQAVLVAKGNPKGIHTLDDLSGKTAVGEQGTVEEQTLKDLNDKFAKAGKPKVNALTYPTDTDAVDQLRIGRADATLHDSPVAAYYAKLNPDIFEVAIPDFASAPEGIASAKTFAELHAAVNKAITAMKADGTLNAIMAKWGIQPPK